MLATRRLRNAVSALPSASASTSTSTSTFTPPTGYKSPIPKLDIAISPRRGPLNNLEVADLKAKEFRKRLSTIIWAQGRTFNDPNYVPPKNGQAYLMIRKLLSEKPRSTLQMMEAGLIMYANETKARPSGKTEVKDVKDVTEAASGGRVSKTGSAVPRRMRIPEDHPFKSNQYLKKTLLDTLETHQLIHKTKIRSLTTTPGTTYGKRPVGVTTDHVWVLSGPKLAGKDDPQQRWSILEHWDKLVADRPEKGILKAYTKIRQQQLAAEKKRRQDQGRERRTEEELWAWDGREPEKSTKRQRVHLSMRHKKTRDAFEAKKLRARLSYDKLQEEGAKLMARLENKELKRQQARGKKVKKVVETPS